MILKITQEEGAGQSFYVPTAAVEYVPECSAVYLMVYIYAIRQAQMKERDISNEMIAAALNINIIDVVNAFLFFSSKGLVKIHNFTSVADAEFDVEFLFPQKQDRAKTDYRPSYKPSEISRHMENNPKVSQMYKIVSGMLGKNLSSADTELLYSLYDFYRLPIEVILVLVEGCVAKGKKSMRYIEKEAQRWSAAGVDSVKAARAQIKKREEFLSYANQVRAALGIGDRRLSARELEYMNKWQNELGMSVQMVQRAYEITVNQTGKLTFAYLNKILESWHGEGIHAPAEISRDKKTAEKASGRYDFEYFEKKARENLKKS